MTLKRQIELKKLESIQGGMSQFYTPQSSHETMLVQIPPQSADDLFVHHFQTDQLLVVKGSFVLVILQNRQYQYIYLTEYNPQVVTIPPGIPHSSINFNDQPCLLVNAVLRHGETHPKDYQPIKKPFPYDLDRVRELFEIKITLKDKDDRCSSKLAKIEKNQKERIESVELVF